MREYRYYGPPGTGKTTALTRQIGLEANQWGAENVIAISHTNAAAQEIASRETDLPDNNIGTMHSLAWRAIGNEGTLAEDGKGLKAFAEAYPKWEFGGGPDYSGDVFLKSDKNGQAALQEYSRLRNAEVPRTIWPLVSPLHYEIAGFAHDWEAWKTETDHLDFTDMLDHAVQRGGAAPGNPHTIVFDELQDSSRMGFRLLQQWGAHAERVITAGDPSQCLYEFSGASVTIFTDHPPQDSKVLSQSYRVPRRVHTAAVEWIKQSQSHTPVTYLPRDAEGTVEYTGIEWEMPEAAVQEALDATKAGQSVIVSASCAFMLRPFLALLRQEAIPFSNPWKQDRSDWNPLGGGSRRHACVQALLDFTAPNKPTGPWTYDEVVSWTDMLKGFLPRGARPKLENLGPEPSCADVYDWVREYMGEGDVKLAVFGEENDRVKWFRRHLKTDHTSLGEYACDVLSAGGRRALEDPPLLHVGTIHSFKGAEADLVMVWPDLSVAGYNEWIGDGEDAVRRLFYVGMTRAREDLRLGAASSFRAVGW